MEDNTAPAPRMKGRFNMYDTPDGGLHITYIEDSFYTDENGEIKVKEQPPEIQHISIPGQAISMMKLLEDGKLSPAKALSMVTKMFGGR